VHSLGVAEEWPVEGSKTKYILVALVVIVIVTASIGFYLIKDGASDIQPVSALDKIDFANQIATDWKSDSILYAVCMQEQNNNGEITAWRYEYYSPSTANIVNNNHTIYTCGKVYLFSNGTHIIKSFNSSNIYPIDNWTIDSDDAYDIAMENSEITSFLHHEPCPFLFQLSNDSVRSIWQIEWCYDAGFDDPKWAEIHIDANTGEVLYVEADN